MNVVQHPQRRAARHLRPRLGNRPRCCTGTTTSTRTRATASRPFRCARKHAKRPPRPSGIPADTAQAASSFAVSSFLSFPSAPPRARRPASRGGLRARCRPARRPAGRPSRSRRPPRAPARFARTNCDAVMRTNSNICIGGAPPRRPRGEARGFGEPPAARRRIAR